MSAKQIGGVEVYGQRHEQKNLPKQGMESHVLQREKDDKSEHDTAKMANKK
jgi:hypothetical protein